MRPSRNGWYGPRKDLLATRPARPFGFAAQAMLLGFIVAVSHALAGDRSGDVGVHRCSSGGGQPGNTVEADPRFASQAVTGVTPRDNPGVISSPLGAYS